MDDRVELAMCEALEGLRREYGARVAAYLTEKGLGEQLVRVGEGLCDDAELLAWMGERVAEFWKAAAKGR
jgi:hypothetical protein